MTDPTDAQLAESLRLLFPGEPAVELAAQRLEARDEITEAKVDAALNAYMTTVTDSQREAMRAALKVAGGVRG
jgi:hypothetical protein